MAYLGPVRFEYVGDRVEATRWTRTARLFIAQLQQEMGSKGVISARRRRKASDRVWIEIDIAGAQITARITAALPGARQADIDEQFVVWARNPDFPDGLDDTYPQQMLQYKDGNWVTRFFSPEVYGRVTIDGRIGRSSVTVGALVTANQPAALATVQQLDPIHVDLTQSSSELLQLRREFAAGTLESGQGLPVTILLEDGTPFPHPGTLAFSEVGVDPATGSYGLRVTVDNPDHVLMPGMYVRAVLGSGVRQNAILVPQQGVTRDPRGNASAMVVNAENKVEQRVLKADRTAGNAWLVEDGLKDGDRLITEGLQFVRPGAEVKAVPASNVKTEQPDQGTEPANGQD